MISIVRIVALAFFFFSGVAKAVSVKGLVSDGEGKPLPYASVLVVGTNKGAIANSQGRYELNLSPGKYTLLCQYVGYAQQKSSVTVQQEDVEVNFILQRQELVMPDVVLTKGEDPAYEIIRSTIAKQTENLDRTREYSCQVYSKGQFRLRSYP